MTRKARIAVWTNLLQGAFYAYLLMMDQKEFDSWEQSCRDFRAGLARLTKNQLVAKIGPVSPLHESQLRRLTKNQLVERVWRAKMERAWREFEAN